MDTVRIEFEPFINEGVRQFIVNGVDYYNIAATSFPDYFPVNFVLRGAGHGTRLMENAEAYARSRGAVSATLETYSFQARPFYERLGYEVFSTLEGYPLGHVKFYLRKALA